MNPGTKVDRWNLIQDIFQSALALPSSERTAYLTRACGNDNELRSEVESLLDNDSSGTATLRSLVAGDLKELAERPGPSDVGRRLGPYRLVRELDGGGMGVVYLAVRSDDQYFQIVAIKMVRKGMETPALLQRFRAERQILATLTHPNIGAILDGGDSEDGRPYIVMEYVEGQPITLTSETRSLSIRRRIELFRSVCSAVHYAHQKLVVHRDIKPSNVLVTSEGIVKLIDFGISKPLAPELIPGELPPTEAGQRLMTPDYASPEQLLGQKITTATDIYSLGVLLFELLTGTRPYTLHDLSPAAAERVICEQESRKPSSVRELSERTRKELSGDLDRIILMAMDKDLSRRYASVDDLDQDLLRFLQAKPVLARKATPFYRLNRFVARHKTASLMACVACVVLAGSILFSSMRSHAADARVNQVQALADSAISDMTEKLQQSSVPVELQASLFHTTLKYLNELRGKSRNDPRVLLKLSKGYERVGDLEGSPFVANLGNLRAAVGSYQQALETATEAHARLPGEESTSAVIEAYQRLGRMQSFLGQARESEDSYKRGLSLARDYWKTKAEDPILRSLVAINYSGLGDAQLDNLETDKALQSFRAALESFGSEPNGREDHDSTLARLYWHLGRALTESSSQADAISIIHKSIAVAEAVAESAPSVNNRRALFVTYELMVAPLTGREILNTSDAKAAEFYAGKALVIAEALASGDRNNMQAHNDLGFGYQGMGDALRLTRPAIAERWYRKSISIAKEMAPRYPTGSLFQEALADREEALAAVLARRGQALEPLKLLQDANGIWKEVRLASTGKVESRLSLMRTFCRLTEAELALNDLATARQYADSSLPFFNEFKPDSNSLLVLRDLGLCYESLGNVQRRIGLDHSLSSWARRAAKSSAHDWYTKSAGVWTEWNRRGAATPESEVERHKVERLLQAK